MLDESRLLRLINSYFDQQLGAEEKRELEAMLLGSAKAREIFLDQAEWHGLTREWALRKEELMGQSRVPKGPAIFRQPAVRRAVVSGLGIAACLALAWWLRPSPGSSVSPDSEKFADSDSATIESEPHEDVALLAQAVDVEWEAGSPLYGVGNALPKGWLKIRRGTLRLDFYSGARVFLEGPAALDLMSRDLARLEHGKLTANVPPPAQGFTILSEELKVIDRGTEFGMSVNGPDDREVHVFNGEVELQGDVPVAEDRALVGGKAISIRGGKWEAIAARRDSFVDPATVQIAATRQDDARWSAWRRASASLGKMPGMLVHFDFEGLNPNSQLIENRAANADPASYGTVIGCEHVSGRWDRKSALGYAKTSDRVRFRTTGTTPSLTMLAWVRVDSLPLEHNSLMSMSPGKVGEIHWKLDKAGRLLLGVRSKAETSFEAWERLVSPAIVMERNFGRWMYLATVINGESGTMKHYVDGVEVASALLKRSFLIQLGMANLGNFDAALPSESTNGPVRSFTGRIDEFALFSRALEAKEIRRMKR